MIAWHLSFWRPNALAQAMKSKSGWRLLELHGSQRWTAHWTTAYWTTAYWTTAYWTTAHWTTLIEPAAYWTMDDWTNIIEPKKRTIEPNQIIFSSSKLLLLSTVLALFRAILGLIVVKIYLLTFCNPFLHFMQGSTTLFNTQQKQLWKYFILTTYIKCFSKKKSYFTS